MSSGDQPTMVLEIRNIFREFGGSQTPDPSICAEEGKNKNLQKLPSLLRSFCPLLYFFRACPKCIILWLAYYSSLYTGRGNIEYRLFPHGGVSSLNKGDFQTCMIMILLHMRVFVCTHPLHVCLFTLVSKFGKVEFKHCRSRYTRD